MHNKTIIRFGFRMIAIIIKASVCVIRLSLRLRQITQNFGLDNYRYHAQPHPIIVNLQLGRLLTVQLVVGLESEIFDWIL